MERDLESRNDSRTEGESPEILSAQAKVLLTE
jgi:hypothetical protein